MSASIIPSGDFRVLSKITAVYSYIEFIFKYNYLKYCKYLIKLIKFNLKIIQPVI